MNFSLCLFVILSVLSLSSAAPDGFRGNEDGAVDEKISNLRILRPKGSNMKNKMKMPKTKPPTGNMKMMNMMKKKSKAPTVKKTKAPTVKKTKAPVQSKAPVNSKAPTVVA